MANPGHFTFRARGRRTQEDWEAIAQRQLDDTQICQAHDIARLGLQYFPQSLKLKQIVARALTRTGALADARTMLEDLCSPDRPDQDTLRRLAEAMRRTVSAVSTTEGEVTGQAIEALSHLYREFGQAAQARNAPLASDEETISLLGRVYKDLWKETGHRDFAVRSRDTYLRAFNQKKGLESYYPAVNAATMSWLIEEPQRAEELAATALGLAEIEARKPSFTESYWNLVTKGEALLLLGRQEEALRCYETAVGMEGVTHGNHVSSLQQLHLLLDHGGQKAFPALLRLVKLFKPPRVVVFVGHRLDEPGRVPTRFPLEMEKTVRKRIDERLDRIDARIGYCSAANGSDILFIEAMRDRGAEVNVVLPFTLEHFVRTSVSHPADRRWVHRFHQAIKSAASVKFATTEGYLNTDALFAFGSEVTCGLAEMRAASLETEPWLVAVSDGRATGLPGGTQDVVKRWKANGHVEIITLPSRSRTRTSRQTPPRLPTTGEMEYLTAREIKTMLFADVQGYSSLHDDDIPRFIDDFLKAVARKLRNVARPGERFVNTWGDALFTVMDDPIAMVEYATALQAAVETTNWIHKKFPLQLRIRIALHAGPVFSGRDPLARRKNYYGSHVNRAARLEPVTLPGKIYATEQFVAFLVSRLFSQGIVRRVNGRATPLPYHCEYVGDIELAKGFGQQHTYHLRKRGAEAVIAI